LKHALDEERHACTAADQVAASLRIQVAALTERAASADDLRKLLNGLQHGKAAAGWR